LIIYNSTTLKYFRLEGLETTILTELHIETMMLVEYATFPCHSVPTHCHSNEQIGVVYS